MRFHIIGLGRFGIDVVWILHFQLVMSGLRRRHMSIQLS
jgi:hypothetical protein